MENFLFTVEDEFYINDLGLILCPGIPREKLPLQVGQPLRIVGPDGSELITFIKEFPMIRRSVYLDTVLILLPKNFKVVDIPIGSQVWLLDSDDTTTP